MLSAQPQFVNADFEQAPAGQTCHNDNIGLVGWTSGAYNEGATCNLNYVCNGERSLELKDFYRETATVANPMAIPAPGFKPVAVRFKSRVGIQESTGFINAYGAQSVGGAKTFLGKVEISTANACEYREIPMPNNVGSFSFFVLEIEMNGGICWIDDIEVIYESGCGVAPTYNVHHDTDWQTIAEVEADIPGSTYGGEVYLSGLNIDPYKKLTIGGDITIHFTTGSHLLMWDHSRLDLWGTLTSCDNSWGGVRTYSNSYFRSFWKSEISNAVWGISSEEWGTYLGSATVESRGGLFLNNGVAIHLYGPSTQQNGYQLYLENCVFKKDANFDPAGRFWGFISLNNMDTRLGGGIYGCHFLNKNPTNQFNFGIESYDSDFLVDDYNGSNSFFSNLGYGIFAVRRGFIRTYDVRNTDFTDCAVGIANRRISSAVIARCTFNMGENLNSIYDGLLCCPGLNLQAGVSNNGIMTNVDIESNVFQSATKYLWTQGVSNYNVGPADNVIYLDTFINLRHGNAAGNGGGLTNAQPILNGTGLFYLCNENQNNTNSNAQWEYDFYARDPWSVRMNQGVPNLLFGYTAAGNTFSQGQAARHFDNVSPAYTVNYYAWQNAPIEIPTNISNTSVIQVPQGANCPTHYFKGDNPKEKMSESEKDENENRYQTNWEMANTSKSQLDAAKQSGDSGLTNQKRMEYMYYRQLFEQAAQKGLRNALNEKTGTDRSAIRMWLARLDNRSADFLLVDDYVGTGEFAAANNILDNMEQKYELTEAEMVDLDDMRDIYALLEAESIEDLNSASIKVLVDMAETEGQASELAKSILGAKGAYYPQIIVTGDAGAYSGNQVTDEPSLKMSVSPNPADYLVTFDWSVFDSAGKTVQIEITNKMGALVKVLTPTNNATVSDWTTEAVSNGICYYRLLIDGQEMDAGHIFITK